MCLAQLTNIINPGLKFSILLVLNYILSGLYLQTFLAWVILQEIFISSQYSSTGYGGTQTFPPR